MNKKCTLKNLRLIGLAYVIIVSIINFLGYLLPTYGQMPIQETEEFLVWIKFMNSHTRLINCCSMLTFSIPALICIAYFLLCKQENINKRIINLPIIFSLIGSLGWFLAFIMEFIFLCIVKSMYKISISTILVSSFLNITQGCLFISTFAFLILDTIHRKFVLPKYFPEGNLTNYKGSIKLSIKILFTVFYLSVSIFPIFYLTSTLYNFSQNYNFILNKHFYFVLIAIVIFGIAMLINFSNYFTEPLSKLRLATKKIKSNNYDTKVDIVSCDDFGDLADNFNDMALALSEKTRKILTIQDSVIKGMAVMIESRDNSTGGHINRTSDCVRVFSKKLKESDEFKNLSDNFISSVIKAAPMHDLGKIAVDDAVLRKPGRFTDEEYEIMKKHSAEGAKIVENVLHEVDDLDFKKIAINVAHYHHEKWNGTGYPEKISGEAIPLEARIMALADVFDALVSKRCYKDSMSYDKAFEIIEDSLGTHFDPILGKLFIETRKELEELYNGY